MRLEAVYDGLVSSAGLASGGYFIQFGASSRKRMRMETPDEPPQSINCDKNGSPLDSGISQTFS